jgi:peptidoglycan/LPS O-acetylase OafA/YrhL
VAVLGVIAYHAAPSSLPGGYTGVDIFFVISGFLISGIILRERDLGHFSVLNFYARRVRRLFPALAVVLAATALLGWYYLLPDEFAALGKHMLAGAGYATNFVLRWEAGYFDAAADAKPLLHLWSLGVEEQFYIVWPVLLLLVRGPRVLLAVIAAIIVASFAGSLASLSKNQVAAFYLPHHRMWQLAVGALLAAIALYRPSWVAFRRRPADIMSIAGVLLIAASMLLMTTRRDYPGFYGLVPVCGAVLLLAAGPQAILNRRILASSAAVFIGLISYPLYLWHWPLLSFAHILRIELDAWAIATVLAATACLATLTYYVIERPIRHSRMRGVTPGLVAATAIIGTFGATAYMALLPPRLNAPIYQDLAKAKDDWIELDGMHPMPSSGATRLFRAGSGPNAVLYIGDSNVQQYWPRVRHLLERSHSSRPIIFATLGGCPPIAGVRLDTRPDCDSFTAEIPRIAGDADITTVVISAAWLPYFANPGMHIDGVGSIQRGEPGWDEAFERLENFIRTLTSNNKSVWLVLPIPYGGTLGPEHAARRTLSGEVAMSRMHANWQSDWSAIGDRLTRVAHSAGARVADPAPALCANGDCTGRTDEGTIIYKDATHLRATYVRQYATFIDQTLEGVATGSISSGGSSAPQ